MSTAANTSFLCTAMNLYVEIKCQLDATDGFLIADLTACSTCFGHHYAHHQELKSIIQVVAACGIWCCKDGRCNM